MTIRQHGAGAGDGDNRKLLGTLQLVLRDDVVPRTVHNFAELLARRRGDGGYRGCRIHRVVPGFVAQGGDCENGDGTGGSSVYGPAFDDENFSLKHDAPGVLSMANSGPDTNGSQFFITFKRARHLDGKHVVFGSVDLSDAESASTLAKLEKVRTRKSDDSPLIPVVVADCGVVQEGEGDGNEEKPQVDGAQQVEGDGGDGGSDENEIDLDDGEGDEHQQPVPQEEREELPIDEDEDEKEPKTRAEALKLRMRKLKLKANQARRLNQEAVRDEGERLNRQMMGGGNGGETRRDRAKAKDAADAEWEMRNAKAVETAAKFGVSDARQLAMQASDSLALHDAKATRRERAKHSVHDYHNPEGQHRNYERSVKSLPRGQQGSASAAASTFNPLDVGAGLSGAEAERERQGAQRLAGELRRRMEKRKKSQLKQKRKEDEEEEGGAGGTTTHINKRNKLFNKKINRTYDDSTKEIRDNLERGTAL